MSTVASSTAKMPVTYVPTPGSAAAAAGGGNAPVIYTADPNVEDLKPADVNSPSTAYSADGTGAFFGWSVKYQKWV
jgi:hypothetical protein